MASRAARIRWRRTPRNPLAICRILPRFLLAIMRRLTLDMDLPPVQLAYWAYGARRIRLPALALWTITCLRNLRVRLGDFFSRMWWHPENCRILLSLPVPVK